MRQRAEREETLFHPKDATCDDIPEVRFGDLLRQQSHGDKEEAA